MSAALGIAGPVLAVLAACVVGGLRPARAAWAGAAAALAAAFALAAWWQLDPGAVLDVPWIPGLGMRLRLEADPLGAPLAVFTAAIAAPILAYTHAYLREHLGAHERPPGEAARFCRLLLGFMLAMLLLLLAQDLVLVFVALELTALASFLLIDFDRDARARLAALTALVVTAGSSLLFLAGALLLAAETGSTVVSEVRARLGGDTPALAAACLVAGVLGKSAQVPLHFWLPRAMVAPTPVSGYLHSAAMVAAGVFVLQRLRPLLEGAPEVLTALSWIGFASVAVGGGLALLADDMKRVLAHSTTAQYGYVLVLLAAGGPEGVAGAPFFVLAHGLCKCALFLTAGAVTMATGARTLSEAGGLARPLPWLAGASAVAAAGLAGLPLTIGWFKDELLFAATSHRGPATAVAATVAAALTVAYAGRWWTRIFLGRARPRVRRPDPHLVVPVVALAAAILLGGVWPAPLAPVFAEAGAVVGAMPVTIELGYHFGGATLWMALAAWAAGLAALAGPRWWQPALARTAEALAPVVGPARWAGRVAAAADRVSDRLHGLEVRDLRDRVNAILLPGSAVVLLGCLGTRRLPDAGTWSAGDLPLATALVVTGAAALLAVRPRRHVSVILLMSFVGYGLAIVFAISGAPDVALVVAVVETLLTILFLAVLWQMRPATLARAREHAARETSRRWPGLLVGTVMFVVAWLALSERARDTVATEYVELADAAHAKDVVTAILADFRGLDTAGELTVLAVAILGAATLTWGRR